MVTAKQSINNKDDKSFPVWRLYGLKNYPYIGGAAIEVFAVRLGSNCCVVVRTNAPNMIKNYLTVSEYVGKIYAQQRTKKSVKERQRVQRVLHYVDLDDFCFNYRRNAWRKVVKIDADEAEGMVQKWQFLKKL